MIPSWLGTRAVFESERVDQAQLREMQNEWAYFRNVTGMQEMVLAKTLPDITEHYEKNLTHPNLHSFGRQLRESLAFVTDSWLKLADRSELLSDSPVIQRSIAVRNPYTDVLNLLQVEALKRYRKGPASEEPDVRTALLLTIIGIAAGMRNTG